MLVDVISTQTDAWLGECHRCMYYFWPLITLLIMLRKCGDTATLWEHEIHTHDISLYIHTHKYKYKDIRTCILVYTVQTHTCFISIRHPRVCRMYVCVCVCVICKSTLGHTWTSSMIEHSWSKDLCLENYNSFGSLGWGSDISFWITIFFFERILLSFLFLL